MSKTEFFYLCLVLGGFSTFAVAMAVGTIVDRAWVRSEARKSRGR